jgi:hypothetical protein
MAVDEMTNTPGGRRWWPRPGKIPGPGGPARPPGPAREGGPAAASAVQLATGLLMVRRARP